MSNMIQTDSCVLNIIRCNPNNLQWDTHQCKCNPRIKDCVFRDYSRENSCNNNLYSHLCKHVKYAYQIEKDAFIKCISSDDKKYDNCFIENSSIEELVPLYEKLSKDVVQSSKLSYRSKNKSNEQIVFPGFGSYEGYSTFIKNNDGNKIVASFSEDVSFLYWLLPNVFKLVGFESFVVINKLVDENSDGLNEYLKQTLDVCKKHHNEVFKRNSFTNENEEKIMASMMILISEFRKTRNYETLLKDMIRDKYPDKVLINTNMEKCFEIIMFKSIYQKYKEILRNEIDFDNGLWKDMDISFSDELKLEQEILETFIEKLINKIINRYENIDFRTSFDEKDITVFNYINSIYMLNIAIKYYETKFNVIKKDYRKNLSDLVENMEAKSKENDLINQWDKIHSLILNKIILKLN